MNGDNVWQSGEPYYGVGLLFRDDNEDGVRQPSGFNAEPIYPGGLTGSSACAAGAFSYPSVANTCLDGQTWNSSIRIRKQVILTLATGEANVTRTTVKTSTGFTVLVADLNGNAMPKGTTVAAEVVVPPGGTVTCTLVSVSPAEVKDSANPGPHVITLDGAADCATSQVKVTVSTPKSTTTSVTF